MEDAERPTRYESDEWMFKNGDQDDYDEEMENELYGGGRCLECGASVSAHNQLCTFCTGRTHY